MIRVLDTLTANSIAAGEVIERPAAVVKELVENSIDAGATKIDVSIEGGGIKLIRVRDNGCGMSYDDAKLCFVRHATSKISQISDLNNLRTMGFRGEALASISAVSRTTLVTRQIGADRAYKIVIEGTDIIESGEVGAAEGTTIEVKKLFFNTPARYKFLKRDSTEAGYIEDALVHIALAHPQIAFSLEKDGVEVLRTPGKADLKSTIYALLGKQIADNLIPLNYSNGEVAVSGYIAAPSISRNNRRGYYILVNQRSVQSSIAQVAIEEACRTRFMKKRFPVILIDLKVPTNFVDVNIHPQKLQVKFRDDNTVFRAIYHAVKDALEEGGKITQASELAPNTITVQTAKNDFKEIRSQQLDFLNQVPKKIDYSVPAASVVKFADANTEQEAKSKPVENYPPPVVLTQPSTVEVEAEKSPNNLKIVDADNNGCIDISELADVEILGQVFNTFILVKNSKHLLLIDQHAAHERILYEQFTAERFAAEEKIYRRELLSAETISVTLSQMAALEKYQDKFLELGFEYEIFGEKTIVLRAVPDLPRKRFERESFIDLIALAENDLLDKVDLIDEMYHTLACKAAIKANDPLSREEIIALIKDLQKLKNPYQCPHGRPTIVYLDRQDLDKLFKRIV